MLEDFLANVLKVTMSPLNDGQGERWLDAIHPSLNFSA